LLEFAVHIECLLATTVQKVASVVHIDKYY